MITIPGQELYDEDLDEFTYSEGCVIELEHSLVSLSKWESIFEKPFLGKEEKTDLEVLEYVKCMVLTPNLPETVFNDITNENLEDVRKYIDRRMSATWFSEIPNSPKSREVITAELIYYWMVAFNIPFQCETWHLNRLFTLIRICNIKNSKPTKMNHRDRAAQQRELNARRKAQLGTQG